MVCRNVVSEEPHAPFVTAPDERTKRGVDLLQPTRVLVVALIALSPDPAAPLTLDAAPIRGDLVLSEGMQKNRTDGAVRFHRLVQRY
jgi:hypothetical protein